MSDQLFKKKFDTMDCWSLELWSVGNKLICRIRKSCLWWSQITISLHKVYHNDNKVVKVLTPTHSFFDTIIYFILNYFGIIKFRYFDLILLYSAGLIDLDHLSSKPIYDPKRNPFKAHFLHKQWKTIIVLSIIAIFFYRPLAFLGIGLLSHLFLDYIYIKKHKL